jgi:hypothetical protein
MLTGNERGHDQESARARHSTWPEDAIRSHFKRLRAARLRQPKGSATNRTHQTLSPQRKVSRLAVSPASAGTDRDGDRSAGHYGAPEEAREEAHSATGSRARQHGRKPAAVRAGEPCPRRPRSAYRALARQPADEQAGSDPTTEFGP